MIKYVDKIKNTFFEKDILKKYGSPTSDALVESAIRNINILEDQNFSIRFRLNYNQGKLYCFLVELNFIFEKFVLFIVLPHLP